MNNSLLTGAIVGALVVAAGGAIAGYRGTKGPDVADVVAVHAAREFVQVPREECRDEVVTRTRRPKDEHRIAGSVIGAVVGGVLGNQIGGGKGQDVATAVGVVGGGYAGNQIQERMQAGNTYTETERKCAPGTQTRGKVIGYDVTYRVDGKEHTARMARDPGTHVTLRNGEPAAN